MGDFKYEIFESALVLILFLVVQVIARKATNRMLRRFSFKAARKKIVIKSVNLLTLLIAFISLAGIWGIDKSQLMFFISSALTILGIGFFAQWSILSNITSGLILFFNHPLKIGDRVKILDKDYPLSGKVEDITYFFLHLKTDDGMNITIPNSVAVQKMIAVTPKNTK